MNQTIVLPVRLQLCSGQTFDQDPKLVNIFDAEHNLIASRVVSKEAKAIATALNHFDKAVEKMSALSVWAAKYMLACNAGDVCFECDQICRDIDEAQALLTTIRESQR